MTADDRAGANTLHWIDLWYTSDDEGRTWSQGRRLLDIPGGRRVTTEEVKRFEAEEL